MSLLLTNLCEGSQQHPKSDLKWYLYSWVIHCKHWHISLVRVWKGLRAIIGFNWGQNRDTGGWFGGDFPSGAIQKT